MVTNKLNNNDNMTSEERIEKDKLNSMAKTNKNENVEEKEIKKNNIEDFFRSNTETNEKNDVKKNVITNKWWVDALIFVGGTMVLGFIAKLLGGEMFGFNGYEMPPATAPQKIFPIIWIIIYIAIGISTYLMWRDKEIKETDRKINLVLFIFHMIFNILWPLFFFRLNLPIFSVFWLIAVIGLACACMYRYFICNLPAGIIFNIYTLWLIYALYLNLGMVLINFC